MGLLDVLNGMQNGPRGQQGANTSSGGMSPIMMAVLGLVAYKALKSFTGQPGADRAAPALPGRLRRNRTATRVLAAADLAIF